MEFDNSRALILTQTEPAQLGEFFTRFGQAMNVLHPTDWYKVIKRDVYDHGGHKLLQQYDNSLYKVYKQSIRDFVGSDELESNTATVSMDFW